jgi:hypothetical protein
MGSIGCAVAFGPSNDLGVTGVGFTLGGVADDLYASLLRHPDYPGLLDRRTARRTGDAEAAIDAFLSLHDAIEAIHGRDIDPFLAGPLVDITDRARLVAGSPGIDPRGQTIRSLQRRCAIVLVVSTAATGAAITCGMGPRLGVAFAGALGSLQTHPLLRAFAEGRGPNGEELEALDLWRDPVIADLVSETELDI